MVIDNPFRSAVDILAYAPPLSLGDFAGATYDYHKVTNQGLRSLKTTQLKVGTFTNEEFPYQFYKDDNFFLNPDTYLKKRLHHEYDANIGMPVKDNELYSRFRDTDASAWVFFAELPEMLQLTAQLIKFGVTFINPSRWPRSFATLRKSFCGAWLGYNFGLSPTISDFTVVIEELIKLGTKQIPTPPVSSALNYNGDRPDVSGLDRFWTPHRRLAEANYCCETTEDGIYFPSPYGKSWLYIEPLAYDRRKLFVPQKVYDSFVTKDFSNMSPSTQAQLYNALKVVHGSGDMAIVSNVLQTIWELIPFSWLVDYFFNVGDFIAKSTLPNTTLYKTARISSVVFDGYDVGLVTKDGLRTSFAHCGVRQFRRTNASVNDWPKSDNIFGLNTPSPYQLSNICALLGSRIK